MAQLTINGSFNCEGGQWNLGGSIEICDAVKLLDTSTKELMKHECGGLQTLLRNHHQVHILFK